MGWPARWIPARFALFIDLQSYISAVARRIRKGRRASVPDSSLSFAPLLSPSIHSSLHASPQLHNPPPPVLELFFLCTLLLPWQHALYYRTPLAHCVSGAFFQPPLSLRVARFSEFCFTEHTIIPPSPPRKPLSEAVYIHADILDYIASFGTLDTYILLETALASRPSARSPPDAPSPKSPPNRNHGVDSGSRLPPGGHRPPPAGQPRAGAGPALLQDGSLGRGWPAVAAALGSHLAALLDVHAELDSAS